MYRLIHWSSSASLSLIASASIAFVPQPPKRGRLSLTRCSVTYVAIETYESSAEMHRL